MVTPSCHIISRGNKRGTAQHRFSKKIFMGNKEEASVLVNTVKNTMQTSRFSYLWIDSLVQQTDFFENHSSIY